MLHTAVHWGQDALQEPTGVGNTSRVFTLFFRFLFFSAGFLQSCPAMGVEAGEGALILTVVAGVEPSDQLESARFVAHSAEGESGEGNWPVVDLIVAVEFLAIALQVLFTCFTVDLDLLYGPESQLPPLSESHGFDEPLFDAGNRVQFVLEERQNDGKIFRALVVENDRLRE